MALADPTKMPERPALSRHLHNVGVLVILLSLAVLGLAIADVVLSVMKYCSSTVFVCSTSNATAPTFNTDPIMFTFIASGIWASIPVFITGILAATLNASHPQRRVGYVQMACVISLMLALPAIIVITTLELIAGALDAGFYSFNSTSGVSGAVWKFAIPLVIGILAVVEFILILSIAVYICRIPPLPEEPVKLSADNGPYRRLDEVPVERANIVNSHWSSNDVQPSDNYRIVNSQKIGPPPLQSAPTTQTYFYQDSNPYGAVPYRDQRYQSSTGVSGVYQPQYVQSSTQSLDRYYPTAVAPKPGITVYSNAPPQRSSNPIAQQRRYDPYYTSQHM